MIHVYSGDNPGRIYRQQLKDLVENPDYIVTVRDRPTRELLNVVTELRSPRNRCQIVPGRKLNPWLALSESLWLLAGRNDVASLLPYNKRITQFSDDGKTLYGAYGYRIADQIELALERLRQEDTDRRAVLQIWRPEDLTANTKDPPCLAGNTVVASPEGDMPIKELVDKKYPVYTLNEESKKIELKWAMGVYRGRRSTIKIVTDAGVLCVTPDHLFLTKEKKRLGFEKKHVSTVSYIWRKADNLQAGMSLVPIWRQIDNRKGYEILRNVDITKNWSGDNKKSIHRMYYEFLYGLIDSSYHVHHLNHNPSDNRRNNFLLIEGGLHSQDHKSKPDGKPYSSRDGFMARKRNAIEEDERTYGPTVSAGTILSRWGKWSNYRSVVQGNHKVLRVEEGEELDVYDLAVEDNHNFFVSPGVLVHNCNTQVRFKVRNENLFMKVSCRSNDLHWGLHAVNLFQFGILQEYIAARLGVGVGTQVHESDSLHIYTDTEGQKITDRMMAAMDEPLQELESIDWLFPNPFPDITHQDFAIMCGAVLDNRYGMSLPRFLFLEFAEDFLRSYREDPMGPIRHAKIFASWMKLAGEFHH